MHPSLKDAFRQLVGDVAPRTLFSEAAATPEVPSTAASVVAVAPRRHALRQLTSRGFARAHPFVALPSRNAPRWMLPIENARATREGFRLCTPYAPRARLLKSVAVQAIRVGWKGMARDRVLLASREPLPLEALIREVTGEEHPVFALSLGTPTRLRKLTVQVMRPDGEILGYVKMPLTEQAGERVRREAVVLERLGAVPALRPHLPRVLHAGVWSEGYILFQSPGPSSPGSIEFGPYHTAFLNALQQPNRVRKPASAVVGEVGTQWRAVAPRLDDAWRALGDVALHRAAQQLDGRNVDCGIEHGDFAPWNTRQEDGSLYVYDWESAEWEAPLTWDFHHFHVQVASLLKKRANGVSNHRSPEERAAFCLYLLRSTGRLLEEESQSPNEIEYRRQLLLRELA